jgi:acyl phosphate:glycerol-3-phosphate acyltransferase
MNTQRELYMEKCAFFLVLAYFLGSIPFGIIFGKLFKGIDIRSHGSGNIGAANAFRALGLWGGLTVLLGDMVKGLLPVICARYFASGETLPYLQVLSGIIAIVGHNYSLFLGFKGGKGIATSFGVILALNWVIALLCLVVWGLMVVITKYSSLGSLAGSFMLPVLMALFREPLPYLVFGIIACLFAFHAHRGNIKRLLEGKEMKITEKTVKASQDRGEGEPDVMPVPQGE